MTDVSEPAERARLHRKPQRGSHDPAVLHEIIDAALICHLGLADHDGHPLVVPTIHARIGDTIYVHGSAASRTLRRLAKGLDVCCTITHLDGIVAARSGFHSSMNYRSVMLFGPARLVDDGDEATQALDAIVDHILPGRSGEIRRPTAKEVAATTVIALPIDVASAKVRTGGPLDDADDVAAGGWAGVVPIRLVADAPIPSDDLAAGVAAPPSVIEIVRRLGG